MIKTLKLGEIQTKVIDGVKSTDELKVLLRYGYGAEITGKLSFNPSEDLKIGDEVKLIIEKVYEEKEMEAEKEAAARELSESLKAEGEEGTATAEGTSEPIKMGGEEGIAASTVPEKLKVEGEGGSVTEEASEPLKAEGEEEGTDDKI
jgi:hypothetical protein